jgi:hypothetical protein
MNSFAAIRWFVILLFYCMDTRVRNPACAVTLHYFWFYELDSHLCCAYLTKKNVLFLPFIDKTRFGSTSSTDGIYSYTALICDLIRSLFIRNCDTQVNKNCQIGKGSVILFFCVF